MNQTIIEFLLLLDLAISIVGVIIGLKALFQAYEARADAVGVQRSTHTIVPGASLDTKLARHREDLQTEVDKLLNPGNESFDYFKGVFDDEEQEDDKEATDQEAKRKIS